MEPGLLRFACSILRQAGRDQRADQSLRERLSGSSLNQSERRAVSQAVLDYFRWQGWIGAGPPSPHKVQQALGLRRRFDENPASFSDQELIRKAVPAWLATEMDVSAAFVRALQQPPILWIRARPGMEEQLARALTAGRFATEGCLRSALRYSGQDDLFKTPQFRDGHFEIQDLHSQAVSCLCQPAPGETWWDACAGEGGKTMHLSALMENKGLIWATDAAAWRLQKLKRRAGRAQVFNYRAALWDGSEKLPFKTKFDGVLVDAPCSGVGAWQRNPQARWTTSPADVAELQAKQLAILRHASAAVKPGGRLVYSVCTLTRSETELIALEFQKNHPEFEPWPTANPLKPAPASRTLRLRTEETGGIGMFVALWKRKG